MTTTLLTPQTSTAANETTGRNDTHLVRTGAVAAIGAAVAATATAALAYAAGVRFEISGETIPMAGFAQLTIVFVAIGAVIAAVLNRKARRPQRTFVVTTVALTALSLVPDLFADAHSSTKLALMLTHVAAAAVAIPLLARRLAA